MPIYEYRCDECGNTFGKYHANQLNELLSVPCTKTGCNGMGDKIYSTFSIGKDYQKELRAISGEEVRFLIIGISEVED